MEKWVSLHSIWQHESNKSTECLRIVPEPWGHIPLTALGNSHTMDSRWALRIIWLHCDIKAATWITYETLNLWFLGKKKKGKKEKKPIGSVGFSAPGSMIVLKTAKTDCTSYWPLHGETSLTNHLLPVDQREMYTALSLHGGSALLGPVAGGLEADGRYDYTGELIEGQDVW